jgi:hypothetical protein
MWLIGGFRENYKKVADLFHLVYGVPLGYYNVYVSYSRASNRARNVPFIIKSLDGTLRDKVTVDQVRVM